MSFVSNIDKDTRIRLGTAVAIVLTLIGCTWRLSMIYGEMKTDVEKVMIDRYTLSMASEQAMRHAMANPGIMVPDPRSPGQYFKIDKARMLGAQDFNNLKGTP